MGRRKRTNRNRMGAWMRIAIRRLPEEKRPFLAGVGNSVSLVIKPRKRKGGRACRRRGTYQVGREQACVLTWESWKTQARAKETEGTWRSYPVIEWQTRLRPPRACLQSCLRKATGTRKSARKPRRTV